jgi:RNA polymerase sigma-70 factor (ECF subfamily)
MEPPVTDAQIIGLLPGCQRGETAAIEALYDLYAGRLYRYLTARTGSAETAEDLTTELFLRVIMSIGKFKPNRSRPAASLSAWLYKIASNLVADHGRQLRRLQHVPLEEDLPLPSADPAPSAIVERQEMTLRLSVALERLTEEQRLVVIGKFGEEMSNREIAALLGKSEGAVESLQHRALHALGRLLDPKDA